MVMEEILALLVLEAISDQELEDCVFIYEMNERKAQENRRVRYGSLDIEQLSMESAMRSSVSIKTTYENSLNC